ncbi:MAG TPA: type II secretion system protein [Candidatus Saccharibacteria bacterium]|nr:type II secretion system protein [Candidatus Saccharibacteria bacterium]HRK94142.1 type II secretion system protein [Candidatus Saccharibacteria bacterium]
MGARNQHGFTIIEVMLFIAVSGILAVALLTGWTTMLNTQRYNDSVKTLQSFLQQQYNLVYNVENGRSKDFVCSDSSVVTPDASSGVDRGQTDCVMMGRYIHIDRGLNVRVYAIVGSEPATSDDDDPAISDIDSIVSYQPKRTSEALGLTETELKIPWEAIITDSDDGATPQSVVIVVIRSPSTGTVHTYTRLTGDDQLPDVVGADGLVAVANEQTDVPLCLDPGAPFSGGQRGVIIKRNASSQSSIQTTDNGEDVC